MYLFVNLLSVVESPRLHVLHEDSVKRVRSIARDFLDACSQRQNDGSLTAKLTCAKPIRVATLSLENVLFLPLLSFVDPAAVAPVVVGVRVCTAAMMLRLMIAPMSSAVGCCTRKPPCRQHVS